MSFDGHKNNVVSVAFERDGRWMVTASEDHTIKLWDIRYVSARLFARALIGFLQDERCTA